MSELRWLDERRDFEAYEWEDTLISSATDRGIYLLADSLLELLEG